MAKVKFGMMMTDASGKLGGQVFSKNRGGSYVRTKVTPKNARTVAQMSSRSLLGNLSIQWNALDISAVRAWNSAVSDWMTTDVFGDSRKPSGKNLFIGLNKNTQGSGFSALALPPSKKLLPSYTGTDIDITVVEKKITLTGFATVPVDTKVQVWATAPITNGISFVKNRLRVIGYISAGAVDPAAIWAMYKNKFGELTATQRIAMQFVIVGNNGQKTVPVIQFGVAS